MKRHNIHFQILIFNLLKQSMDYYMIIQLIGQAQRNQVDFEIVRTNSH